jgi:alpha-1,2-mannosyltransferase
VNSVLARARDCRALVIGSIAFAVAVILYTIYGVIHPAGYTLNPVDLRVYMDGGEIVRHEAGLYNGHLASPLYDWGGYSSLQLKFTYPPIAAICFAVVSFIPWVIASHVSMAVTVLALLAVMWFTFGGLGYSDRRVRLGATLLASAAVFWTQPVLRNIYLGQVNLVLVALTIWDLCQPSGRWWKGIGTGIAAGIKLTPLVFIPYLLVTRRYREAIMTVAGFAGTVVLGFIIIPKDSAKWWFGGLFLQGGRTGFTGWAGNQSLRGLITRLSGSIQAGSHPWLIACVFAVAMGMLAAALLDRAGFFMPGLLAAALTGLLVSPISWDHHWVWFVVPAVAVAGHYAWQYRDTARRAAIGCLAIALGIIAIFGAWPTSLWGDKRHLGEFSLGFIWGPANTTPREFVLYGDQRRYAEYHWHGIHLLTGNAYILTGIALLIIMLVVSLLLGGNRTASQETRSEEASVPAPHSAPAA